MYLRAATLDDLLRDTYLALLEKGTQVSASRGTNIELIGVRLELEKPRARLSRTETRGRPFSALGEFLWYLTGDNRLDFIEPYIPAYKKDSTDGITVHGAYGPRIFNQRGNDQLENAIEQLKSFPSSRRAVIQIFDAEDIATRYTEIPCTTTLQFLLRDGALHLIATMRSNDVHLGLPHDVFCFTMLQEYVARILNVDLGKYHHFAGSMHLYEKDRSATRQYLEECLQRCVEMPPMPGGDPRPAMRTVFNAERDIRAKKILNLSTLNLDPYWADLVTLLQIHFSQGNDAKLDELRSQLCHDGYKIYVEGQRGKKTREIFDPRQGVLPI